MNVEQVERAGVLARQIREIDAELAWLARQDGAPFQSSAMVRCMTAEYGLYPTPETAAKIRAILREDYTKRRAMNVSELSSLGVEFEAAA